MTKTVLDIVDDVYQLLNVPEITNVIKGYKDKRPDKISPGEYWVVNSLPVTGSQLQSSVVNVNIHVPDLSVTIESHPGNSLLNRKRLKQLSNIFLPKIKDAIINDMVTEIQNVALIEEKEQSGHFLNIRVLIHSINL